MDDIMKPHFKKEYGEAEVKRLQKRVDRMGRLESIKERLKNEEYIKRDIDFYEAHEDIEYLILEIDKIKLENPEFWSLYDRFQDKIAENLKLKDENEMLLQRLEIAQKALEIFANRDNWSVNESTYTIKYIGEDEPWAFSQSTLDQLKE